MNLSKDLSVDKELFSGTQVKENTLIYFNNSKLIIYIKYNVKNKFIIFIFIIYNSIFLIFIFNIRLFFH